MMKFVKIFCGVLLFFVVLRIFIMAYNQAETIKEQRATIDNLQAIIDGEMLCIDYGQYTMIEPKTLYMISQNEHEITIQCGK